MAAVEPRFVNTAKGVKVELKALYVYPDGHANLTFADGTNWLVAKLLRPMQVQARRRAHGH
jgi:hypothetical protein